MCVILISLIDNSIWKVDHYAQYDINYFVAVRFFCNWWDSFSTFSVRNTKKNCIDSSDFIELRVHLKDIPLNISDPERILLVLDIIVNSSSSVSQTVAQHMFCCAIWSVSEVVWNDIDYTSNGSSEFRGIKILVKILKHPLWSWTLENLISLSAALKVIPLEVSDLPNLIELEKQLQQQPFDFSYGSLVSQIRNLIEQLCNYLKNRNQQSDSQIICADHDREFKNVEECVRKPAPLSWILFQPNLMFEYFCRFQYSINALFA